MKQPTSPRRRRQILIAIDQLANTIIQDGWADETISARAWRLSKTDTRWAKARQWIDRLFFWEPDHCKASYEAEQQRRHLPPEYRPVTAETETLVNKRRKPCPDITTAPASLK